MSACRKIAYGGCNPYTDIDNFAVTYITTTTSTSTVPIAIGSVWDKGYRYKFNGKETGDETGLQDYGFRICNPSLGKFLSRDPLADEYSWNSAYAFAECNPIWAIDLDGLEAFIVTYTYNKEGKKITTLVHTDFDLVKQTELSVVYVHNYPDDPTKNKTDAAVKQFKTEREIRAAGQITKSMRAVIAENPNITEANKSTFSSAWINDDRWNEPKEPTKPVGTKKAKKPIKKKPEPKVKDEYEEKIILTPKYKSKYKMNETEMNEIKKDADVLKKQIPDVQFDPSKDIEWGTESRDSCGDKVKWKMTDLESKVVKVKKEKNKNGG